ncbi:hypothetical protein B296_00026025 [Ensete ventricosum]|uniref:Uncharacterized protein n=1 Tax=Ensete ventricosum TaxID=4639 RepID=A0A426ZFF0_ENSVE|nr:hypothetical protein B296_00026025 [Ensete ventricosum]
MGSWNWIPLFWKGDKVSSRGFHSSSTAEEITEGIDASPLTAIVTGTSLLVWATSGIGKETARVLALRGATVVIPCRSLESGVKVKEGILEQNADAKIHVMEMDLSSLDSVDQFSVVSAFILDAIAVATKPFLKSIPQKLSDPSSSSEYRRSMCFELQGASTTCYLALHPDMKDVTGKYFGDCNETLPSAVAREEELSIKCWEFSQQLLNNLRGPTDLFYLPIEALQTPSPPYVRDDRPESESRFFARPFRLTSCLHPRSPLKMMGVSAASPSSCCLPHARSHLGPSRFTSLPFLIPFSKKRPGFCRATKQQQQTGAAKKKAGRRKAPERPLVDDGGRPVDVVPGPQNRQSHSSPLPKPPAGFVLDDHGRVLLASSKRIVTIVR